MESQTRNYYVHVFIFVLARQYIKLWIINYSTSPYLLFNKIFQKRYIEKKTVRNTIMSVKPSLGQAFPAHEKAHPSVFFLAVASSSSNHRRKQKLQI
jgi:hypothetical protein